MTFIILSAAALSDAKFPIGAKCLNGEGIGRGSRNGAARQCARDGSLYCDANGGLGMNISILDSCLTNRCERFRLSQNYLMSLLRICVVFICASAVQADTSQPPAIVAQGFDISQTREGILGSFSRLRIRVEVPEGIRELRVKERSYEVDLATTLELSNLQLFGLDKRARRYRDLTLNFQNYLNSKIENEGRYTFEITVTDNKDRTVTAMLNVVANRTVPDDSAEIETFRLMRIGSGPVQGSPDFGVTWKTIESSRVVIRIGRIKGGATMLGKVTESDYEGVKTKKMLQHRVQNTEPVESIDLATVNNAASGEVMAVVFQDRKYLIRVRESKIAHSDLGTIVTLLGDYKY